MLETLCLLVDLVPAVAEDLNQEHLQKAVVPDELERDLPALAGELLAAVAVVFDQPLGGEPRHHLADRRRGDAEALREVARRDRAAVAVKVVERLQVVLLRPGEGAAPGELDRGQDLGFPKSDHRRTYH